MKTTIIALLVLASQLAIGQKLDITIIGTAHHFKEEYKDLQSLNEVRNFIVDLKPDIICIEAIPTNDTLSLKEVYPNTMRKARELGDTLDLINGYSPRVLKGAHHFTSYDFWNAYYHWFQIQEAGDSLGYFSKFQKKLSNSEYGLIVFPAAQQIGIEKFYGIDYRDGEDEFLANNQTVLKKLFFKLKWKPLRLYLKTQKQYKKAEKNGKLIEFINGDEFQGSFPRLIEDIPNRLSKSKEAREIKSYWLMRNRIMAERIIETAKKEGAQNVLLTIGSAHVFHIKKFLEERGHNVTTYGQIMNTQNH